MSRRSRVEIVAFLHGLGDGPESWAHQVAALPPGFAGVPLDVLDDGGFGLASAAEDVVRALDRRGVERAHLCGLSLGAMIALQTALGHPDRVASLVLAAGQVRPPRLLMAAQLVVMRLLPERVVASGSASKAQMLAVLRAVADTDFSDALASVGVPTLVLCGSRDRANLPAARTLAAGIPGAGSRILEGAGHQANAQAPEAFSEALAAFLTTQG